MAKGVVLSISRAGNLLVVRSRPGFAQSVAASIDALSWGEVLGTVGGDDTLLIVLGDQREAAGVEKRKQLFFALGDSH